MIYIGPNIARIRQKAGLTQSDLACRSNVSLSSICRYETDQRHPPFWIVYKLSLVLCCSLEDFLIDDHHEHFENYSKK